MRRYREMVAAVLGSARRKDKIILGVTMSGAVVLLVAALALWAHGQDPDQPVALLSLSVMLGTLGVTRFLRLMYRSQKEAAEAQRMEIERIHQSQNRFFSAMSHEIRTPINTILGCNELTLREGVTPTVAANAQNINAAGRILLTIINDILDLSKIQAGQMELAPAEYSSTDLISDTVMIMTNKIRAKQLRFVVNADPNLPRRLHGDDVRIKQVLINLLNNAAKYTSKGSITFTALPDRVEGNTAWVRYEIEDTGIGIRSEDMPGIFDAYTRMDSQKNRNVEGTGIGLSIVRSLVQLMNGEITVNSIYTKGSIFAVTIPQRIVDPTPMGELTLVHSAPQQSEYAASFTAPMARILIVDDNEMNLRVATGLLAPTKVVADTANSGAKCLELTLRTPYHLILMDHVMPVMDGVQTLAAVRTQTGGLCCEVPVVALTANVGSDIRELYANAGFTDYLPKPIDPALLEEIVARYLPPELVTRRKSAMAADTGITHFGRRKPKKRIAITTESPADLPEQFADEHGIFIIPFYIHTSDGSRYLDEVEIDSLELENFLSAPGTSAYFSVPSKEDYLSFFARQLERADRVIHLSILKRGNRSSYANACEAAATLGNVTVINSMHASGGLGALTRAAARKVDEGVPHDELVRWIENQRQFVQFRYLAGDSKMGRLPPLLQKICGMLMLFPIVKMGGNAVRLYDLKFGPLQSARRAFIRSTLLQRDVSDELLGIVYSNLAKDELDELVRYAAELRKFDEVVVQRTSASVLTMAGSGSIGLVYIKADPARNAAQ